MKNINSPHSFSSQFHSTIFYQEQSTNQNLKVGSMQKKIRDDNFTAKRTENIKTISFNFKQESKFTDLLKTTRPSQKTDRKNTKIKSKKVEKTIESNTFIKQPQIQKLKIQHSRIQESSSKPQIRYKQKPDPNIIYDKLLKSAKNHSQQAKQILQIYSTQDPVKKTIKEPSNPKKCKKSQSNHIEFLQKPISQLQQKTDCKNLQQYSLTQNVTTTKNPHKKRPVSAQKGQKDQTQLKITNKRSKDKSERKLVENQKFFQNPNFYKQQICQEKSSSSTQIHSQIQDQDIKKHQLKPKNLTKQSKIQEQIQEKSKNLNRQTQTKNDKKQKIQTELSNKIKSDYLNIFKNIKQPQILDNQNQKLPQQNSLLNKKRNAAIKIQAVFRGYYVRRLLNNFVNNYKSQQNIQDENVNLTTQSQKQSDKQHFQDQESFCLFDDEQISPIQQEQQKKSPSLTDNLQLNEKFQNIIKRKINLKKFTPTPQKGPQYEEWEQIKLQIKNLKIGEDQETRKLLQNLEQKFLNQLTPENQQCRQLAEEPSEQIVQNDSYLNNYSNLRNFIGSETLLRQSWEKNNELQYSGVSNISQQFFKSSFTEFIQKKMKDLMNQDNMQQLLDARQKVVNMRVHTEKKNISKKLQKNDITPETFKQKTRELEVWKQKEISELDQAQKILQKNWQILFY